MLETLTWMPSIYLTHSGPWFLTTECIHWTRCQTRQTLGVKDLMSNSSPASKTTWKGKYKAIEECFLGSDSNLKAIFSYAWYFYGEYICEFISVLSPAQTLSTAELWISPIELFLIVLRSTIDFSRQLGCTRNKRPDLWVLLCCTIVASLKKLKAGQDDNLFENDRLSHNLDARLIISIHVFCSPQMAVIEPDLKWSEMQENYRHGEETYGAYSGISWHSRKADMQSKSLEIQVVFMLFFFFLWALLSLLL